MKKLWMLIRVLFKCGKNSKTEKSNSAVGDTKTLITLAVGVAAIVGMFMAGQYAADHMNLLGSGDAIFSTIMIAAGMVSFVMALMNAVNQLYISSDLDVLVTLPFTPTQIVIAKMLSVFVYPAGICFAMIVPAAIGFSMKVPDLSAMFIPSVVIGVILLSVYVVALLASLLMIIMRIFRFVRSRNMISVLSTLAILALTIVYLLATSSTNQLDEAQAVGLFNSIKSMTTGLSFLFPTVGLSVNAAYGQPICLLYAFLITVGAVLILMLLSRTIYFSAAMGMTDANGARGPIKPSEMKKHTAKLSVRKTLARHEIRQILRTPAMITNGYLYSILLPFFVVIPILLKIKDEIDSLVAAGGAQFSLETLRQMLQNLKISPMMILICCILFGMLMAVLAVSLSCLSRYLISREGKNFETLKTMPISGHQLVFVKRNVAMLINGISGLIIPVGIYIAGAVMQLIPLWVAALSIVTNIAFMVMFIDICAAVDVEKPNLNWETETDVMKNNYTGMILLLITFVFIGGIVFLLIKYSNEVQSLDTIIGIALCAVAVIGAALCDLRLRKLSDKLF